LRIKSLPIRFPLLYHDLPAPLPNFAAFCWVCTEMRFTFYWIRTPEKF
jgi:hypothetical protein